MESNLTGIQQPTENDRADWSPAGNGGLSQGENLLSQGESLPETPTDLAQATQPYTDKIADTASQAKDFLSEKFSAVGGKIKEFATDDLGGLAGKAKDFARQNPGQAILVSAVAGVILGLIVRGRR